MAPRRVIILGSTGSIGCRALDVIRDNREEFEVVGLSTRGNVDLLARQVQEFQPVAVAVATAGKIAPGFPGLERGDVALFEGADANVRLVQAHDADLVLVATVGISGLEPTLAALRPGMEIALANKEVLVAGGELVMARARELGVSIHPVDSEHNALAQCLRGHGPEEVRRVILTASGGPFRESSEESMAAATPEQALRHPTWSMGAKITIDCATLMNKGFEVLEAAHLFGLPLASVDVVIHPGSIVHSLVEFVDGSILAQLGPKDMYLPIQNCLFGLARRSTPVPALDLFRCGPLEFRTPDHGRFPCLELAYSAGRRGGLYPAVLNAANEVAVERFLAHDIGFMEIPGLVGSALAAFAEAEAEGGIGPGVGGRAAGNSGGIAGRIASLSEILEADAWGRKQAGERAPV
jgi:1-deoxy-D-xylulose-5-phosphate reductoisomerase